MHVYKVLLAMKTHLEENIQAKKSATGNQRKHHGISRGHRVRLFSQCLKFRTEKNYLYKSKNKLGDCSYNITAWMHA